MRLASWADAEQKGVERKRNAVQQRSRAFEAVKHTAAAAGHLQSNWQGAMRGQPVGPPAVGTASGRRSGRLWLAGRLPSMQQIRRQLPAGRQLCERHQRTE